MREDKLSDQSMDFAVDIINLVKELKLKKDSIFCHSFIYKNVYRKDDNEY